MNGMLTETALQDARRRLVQMHFEAGVGHVGGNLSCIDAVMLVFHEMLGADDRFILSKGHSVGALYIALWSIGRLDDDALRMFHKDGTLLAGHPPVTGIPDILFATGSLGHGLSLAAGTALGMRMKGGPGNVVCLTSDGEWQEGSTWEALIFASHRRLTNLTILVDHNGLQGFGTTTEIASMSPLSERLKGFDVEIVTVDGHDVDRMRAVFERPAKRMRVVVLQTVKGKGLSFLEGRMESHYLPLTGDQFQRALVEMRCTETA